MGQVPDTPIKMEMYGFLKAIKERMPHIGTYNTLEVDILRFTPSNN